MNVPQEDISRHPGIITAIAAAIMIILVICNHRLMFDKLGF